MDKIDILKKILKQANERCDLKCTINYENKKIINQEKYYKFDNCSVEFMDEYFISYIFIDYESYSITITYTNNEVNLEKITKYFKTKINYHEYLIRSDIYNKGKKNLSVDFYNEDYYQIKKYFDYHNNVKNILEKKYDKNISQIIMSYLILQ